MSTTARPVVLVLASGRGERFAASGGQVHKLQALLAGKPVMAHTLDAVRRSGLPFHVEDAGHPGMGDSIAAAVRAAPDAPGWLVLPADLPLIQPGTLRQVAEALRHHAVVAPYHWGQRGHPVGFGPSCRDALMALSGPHGAAPVMRAAAADGRMLHMEFDDIGVVTDIDTVSDLEAAQRLLG